MFVHEDVCEAFIEKFVAATAALERRRPDGAEDRHRPDGRRQAPGGTDAALGRGGRRGRRQGARAAASARARSSSRRCSRTCRVTAKVCSKEAFAPSSSPSRFATSSDAIAHVNDSKFGLQAGVFTNDLANAWRAFEELEVGGVIVNDVPTYRDRQHALRRRQGLRPRPRGRSLRDRGHDRAADHGARPARNRNGRRPSPSPVVHREGRAEPPLRQAQVSARPTPRAASPP